MVEQVALLLGDTPLYFWGTHSGAELDVLFTRAGRNIGIEIKRTDAPRITPSMRNAITDLGLDHLYVIYPGAERYPLAPNIEALPVVELGGLADR